MKPVPVDVVTGFLGAGKTTLLVHVLGGALLGERVAVVVNELGDVSIDGRTIERLEHIERMVELDGGCICCAIDDYRFDAAIQELVERADPTLIVLETSGAADPSALPARLARAGLFLDAIITVVDAADFDRALAESPVARAQIRAADFLVLNKIDLAPAGELERVRRRVRRLNRRAAVLKGERGRVPADMLWATAGRRYRRASQPPPDGLAGAPGHGHDGEEITAFSWRGSAPLDRRRFERFLAALPREVYRAKGIVLFAGASWPCLFNFTCGRYELNWIQLAGARAEAVFIGREAERVRQRVLDGLGACEAA